MKKSLLEIWLRLRSETPTHFNRIIALGLSVGAIGAAILAIPVTASAAGVTLVLPAMVTQVAGYMIAAGAIAAGVSKTAVVDPKKIQERLDKTDNLN
jgi:hypothetical protein